VNGPVVPVGPVVAVGAVIVAAGNLLLIRRKYPPGAGRGSIPSGRVAVGEQLRAAVAREVREETGLDVIVGDLAGWVERFDEGFHYVILDFFAGPVERRRELTAGDDATDARWVPFASVAELDLVDGLLDFLRQVGSLPA
jgi:ADP-ribose pyrophosphatase YjhB (NUDIX family)